jgi:hypothetical protein
LTSCDGKIIIRIDWIFLRQEFASDGFREKILITEKLLFILWRKIVAVLCSDND